MYLTILKKYFFFKNKFYMYNANSIFIYSSSTKGYNMGCPTKKKKQEHVMPSKNNNNNNKKIKHLLTRRKLIIKLKFYFNLFIFH